jgi:phosphoribosyl-ATP pyrophosphohydrolase/phosphoribosyl-AMP cyclohydrolase
MDWEKGGGLLPAVVQHARTGALLMVGYMNREALERTLTGGRVTFFSRSRQALWSKGETSGHFLETVSVCGDCDRDTILVQALPAGPVCHAGTATCFPGALPSEAERFAYLGELERIIADRLTTRRAGSYTASLQAEGPLRMAQKVGEEGLELALAAAASDDGRVLAEAADLLFHVAVLLKQRGLSLAQVVGELELRRAGGQSRD